MKLPSRWLASFPLACLLCLLPASSMIGQTAGLQREFWKGLSVTNNSYPDSALFTNTTATSTSVLADFEAPQNAADGYGQRVRGYLLPPITGDYTFWIASDEWSDLFLSSDETPDHLVRIANVTNATGFHEWTREPNQRSLSVTLQAGRRYLIQAVHKEGTGPDHLSVRWQLPDGSIEEPLPGKVGSTVRMLLYKPNNVAVPTLANSFPTQISVVEGAPIILSAPAGNPTPVNYQWQLNGVDLPGEISSVFSIDHASLALHDGQTVRCRLSTAAGNLLTPEARITVQLDQTPPQILRVTAPDLTHLSLEFSEPIASAPALNVSNYTLDGGVTVLGSAIASPVRVVLTTTSLTRGKNYQIQLRNLSDLATPPNAVAVNTSFAFTAMELGSEGIGGLSTPGTVAAVPGGFELTVASKDIGGISDQFQFAWQPIQGDFDFRVRVGSLKSDESWAKGGLMARASNTTNSAYVAVFASGGVEGCFFASRQNQALNATQQGAFPLNDPDTWLRLRRTGNLFTGFASRDGDHWLQLGSAIATLPNDVLFGLAAASKNLQSPVTTRLLDLSPVVNPGGSESFDEVEPIGPSSRKTGLAITEIHYKPRPIPGITNSLEFLELYNSNPYPEDISGYRIAGDVDFTFPEGTVLRGGAFAVVARDPEGIRQVYGLTGVLGPFVGTLKSSGRVQLKDRVNAVFLEIPYSNRPPWPIGADGTGHSLVLSRPSYGEGYPQAWGVSDLPGGSPGKADGYGAEPLRGVLINEFLANSVAPDQDYLELYNHTDRTVDLSGAWLSDSPTTNRFRILPGTTLPPGGLIRFTEGQLGFSLSAEGESIFLVNAAQTRILDAVRYEDQAPGVALGRFPDGGAEWYPQQKPTPGQPNSGPLVHDVVINEILYKPITGKNDDAFVELYNQGDHPVDLSGWRFVSGIQYTFGNGIILPAKGYLVIANNLTNLLSRYPGQLTRANTVGNFQGKPSSDGARIALAQPVVHVTTGQGGVLSTNVLYPVVDEVTFGFGGRWGDWADGNGSSLELRDPRANHRFAYNWGDSDETRKAPWTTMEATGTIDNSGPQDGTINRLEITLLNAGECLLDNLEVTYGTNSANRLANSTFEGGLSPWVPQGNHIRTTLEEGEGFESSKSLHLRASARGDTGANRIRVALTGPAAEKQTCTIRAKGRWLRGWPELIVRLEGNGFELAGTLTLPSNLGTPGARNSIAVSNAPPAIARVKHTPVLPAAGEGVRVTAVVDDPDGVQQTILRYRIDPLTNWVSVVMSDDGAGGDVVAGDGVVSGVIPGQTAGTLVAFHLESTDRGSAPSVARFPADAPVSECLVRFGEPTPASGYATYHYLVTSNNVRSWINRPSMSNERIDGTFIYGNFRAIYNISGKYSGSPYHQGFNSPATDACHYSLEFPLDDLLLGTENFNKIHAPGNGPFDDDSLQREQTSYWILRQMGLPYNYRRFVAFYFNGNRKGAFMEDTQTPGSDVLAERFPDDSNGNLYKLQPWFEFDDITVIGGAGAAFNNNGWCTLLNHYTGPLGNTKKLARYRYNFLTRAANGTANDYTNVWDLCDAAGTGTGGDYVGNMKHLVDMEQWMRTFAVQHSVGNWDSFGNRNAQNMYGYKPTQGKWVLMTWDLNIVLGNSSSDGPTGDDLFQVNSSDTAMARIYQTPEFRRMYWRAFREIADGPMNNPFLSTLMDAKYKEFVASGQAPANPSAIKSWINARRDYLRSQLATVDAAFGVIGNTDYDTNGVAAVITGTAPVQVKKITINGNDYPLTWVNVTTWRVTLPLDPGTNTLVVQAVDRSGNSLPGMSATVTIRRSDASPDPRGLLVFNEIMYHPTLSGASYVEIYNRSTQDAFDLSGWRIDGLSYTFPEGTIITNRQYLVVAKDRTSLWRAYGMEVPALGDYNGGLSDQGEVLSLIRPGTLPADDLVVDRVRYDSMAPWPTTADGLGSSLQLIDSAQENSRVSNWSDGRELRWIKASITATNKGSRLVVYLPQPGDLYVDDISVTDASGNDVVINGGFEDPLAGSWIIPASYSGTRISTEVAHSGKSSLHLVGSANGGFTTNTAIWQDSRPIATNTVYTLTYWYLPSTNGFSIGARTLTAGTLILVKNKPPVFFSPGEANGAVDVLPEYPELWLNELEPYNRTGVVDRQGDHEPWVELFNAGKTSVSLAGWFLSTDASHPLQWAFPSGVSIGAGEFLRIWLDDDAEATEPGHLHAALRPDLDHGSILLSRVVAEKAQIVDYLNYTGIGADESYGAFPDGQPFFRQKLAHPTPGEPNDATPPTVKINEWMAGNASTILDPADSKYHDWFELYNPASTAADLGGFFVSDNPSNLRKFTFPVGTVIPPQGYLLLWADKLPSANAPDRPDLHVNFNLDKKNGSVLTLSSPSGEVVDTVTFGRQTDDVSQGRFPDGSEAIHFMNRPTPRAANVLDGNPNTPPVLSPIANQVVGENTKLTLLLTANDAESSPKELQFTLGPGAPAGLVLLPDGRLRWRPSEAQGPSTVTVRVQVSDAGSPSLTDTKSFQIQVLEVNSPPFFDARAHYGKVGERLSFGTGTDSDIPAQVLAFTLPQGGPAGLSIDPVTGVVTWIPTASQVGHHSLLVEARDNGVPSLVASYSYNLEVVGADQTLLVGEIAIQAGQIVLSCQGISGRHYQLQATVTLSNTTWVEVGPPVTATTESVKFTDSNPPPGSRYYRIVQLP